DNKLELIPKLMPTCQTPAADGMVVYTKSPKSIANQKAVMEYLLINHPLDCPVCDQAGECHLQDYSYKYGRAASRFRDDKIKQPKKDVGEHIYLYSDRCIMCTRCVRFTSEITGTRELSVQGRGNREQIDIFPGQPLANELSGNVVDVCPVGALLDKDFLFTQRVWFLKSTPSIDGVTASGDNLWIDHNEGKIYRLKPRTNLDVNKWWISDEIRYGWKFVHSESRLTAPMRQQLGLPSPTDWPSAMEEAAGGLIKIVKEKGPGSLALLASPMLASEEAYLLAKTIRAIDPQATLAIGPVPTAGQDKTFPGGYTTYAEKCPNRRGVRRALELVAGSPEAVLDIDAFTAALSDKASKTQGVLLTGNYPSPWATKDFVKALGKRFTILLDTLPTDLSPKVNLLLPSVTWAEKAGCFENAKGLIQAFEQAIPAIEFGRPEGQIALDLLAAAGLAAPQRYDAQATRQQMGAPFAEVALPSSRHDHEAHQEPALQYVEL
ncbi:MAG: hypothetical protein IT441_08800, partial [Phycisphaeraceae bacterium]|nr:hypothetical protein [Phycisphaeraceae bacterium]